MVALGMLFLSSSSKPSEEPQPLRGTIQIVHEKYCKDEHGYAFILNVRVRLTNTTTKKLIIDKGPFYYGFAVARDADALSKKIYEYHPGISMGIEHSREPDTNAPDVAFAILNPGNSIQTEVDFWGNVFSDEQHSPPGSFPPGKHVLRFWISTWSYSSNPDSFRERWGKFGTIVDSSIATDPFQFDFPTSPKFSSCK